MHGHLSDDHLMEILVTGGTAGADQPRAHLAACSSCRARHTYLEAALAGFGAWTREMAERPEDFWREQGRAIRARLAEPVFTPARRLAWAGTLAVIVLAAVLLARQTPPKPEAAHTDLDHVLLVDVERSVRREVPRALEPAALLAQEIRSAAREKSNP